MAIKKPDLYPFFARSENVERINSYSYDCEATRAPKQGMMQELLTGRTRLV